MKFNKPVSNPLLIGAVELLKAEPTTEHRALFIGEMLKAEFLTPVILTPEPEQDEEGNWKLTNENKVQFPTLSAPDGKQFFMAFTDKSELEKWRPGEQKHTFSCTYEDYFAMLMRRDKEGNYGPAWGFVINPFGCNMVVDRNMIINLFVRKNPPQK
ncbi:MAG: SseB family protein [Roseburia sp.]|nr:SseB family protein [Roseburia sp.]